jgi:hypothetical protein
MTPVLFGVAAVMALVLVVYLLAGGTRLIRRGLLRIKARLRRFFRRRARSASSPDLVERDWIYSDRPVREAKPDAAAATPQERTQPVREPAAAATTGAVEAPGILRDAEAEAAAILNQAKQEADAILAAANAAKARLEQEAARDRALAAEERTKLTAFLSEVLDEVQRTGVAAQVTNLDELRKLKRESELQ